MSFILFSVFAAVPFALLIKRRNLNENIDIAMIFSHHAPFRRQAI
jgi:hypothetical protein